MSQTTFACSRVPGKSTCSVQITGDKTHVVAAAKSHLESDHGHKDPKLEQKIASAVDEPDGNTAYSTWV